MVVVASPPLGPRRRCHWRRRQQRLAERATGDPHVCSAEQAERVIVTILEQAPTDATHWSTRSLARQLGMSQTSIRRIWRAFGSNRT